MLIPANCKAVENFKAGLITEPELWTIIRSNINVSVDPEEVEYHSPSRGEQVYNYNRVGKGQPNGYVSEVEEYGPHGLVTVHWYEEPEEAESIFTQSMDWHHVHRRWYIPKKKSRYFRDKLIILRARKAGMK